MATASGWDDVTGLVKTKNASALVWEYVTFFFHFLARTCWLVCVLKKIAYSVNRTHVFYGKFYVFYVHGELS